MLYPAKEDPTNKNLPPSSGAKGNPLVIPNCHLVVFDKQKIPSPREGVLLFVGDEITKEDPDNPGLNYHTVSITQGNEEILVKAYKKWKEGNIVKPGQIFNRIHVDDIAGSLLHLAQLDAGGIFNVTDDEPAPPQDVVAFAARLMGVAPPPEIDFDTADLSPMARSFYGENKRVSNAKLKATGYRFVHPNYRAALTAMWEKGNWRRD